MIGVLPRVNALPGIRGGQTAALALPAMTRSPLDRLLLDAFEGRGGPDEGSPGDRGAARATAAGSPARWRERFVAGDRRAFGELVRVLSPRVRATLVRLVGSRDDAEDLAQETFVRAWKRREQFDGRGSVEGWLVRIAVHLARDFVRRSPRPVLELDAERDRAQSAAPDAVARDRELRRALRRSIAVLPQRLREPFVLRVLEERSYDDVAAICGVTAGTARIQVMKARRRLMEALRPHLSPGPAGDDRSEGGRPTEEGDER